MTSTYTSSAAGMLQAYGSYTAYYTVNCKYSIPAYCLPRRTSTAGARRKSTALDAAIWRTS